MKNILFINTRYQAGGAEKVTVQLYEGIKRYGFNSYLAVGFDEKCQTKNDSHIFTIFSKDYEIKMNTLYRDNCLFMKEKRNYYALIKLLFIIKKYHINIIHLHNVHGGYLGIEDIGILANHCPIIWTMHDAWPITGHCPYPGQCKSWLNGCVKKGLPKKNNCSMLLEEKKKIYSHKNIFLVSPSEWLSDLTKMSIAKNNLCKVINNGVDLKRFSYRDKDSLRNKYNLDHDKKYILFIAQNINDGRKGFRYLVEAINKLEGAENYCILLVGEYIRKSYFPENCKVIQFGYISKSKKMNEIFTLADVFILPSMDDNFPCVTLESMASGTPVIAFKSGGIPEQISNSVGWLTNERTSENLANMIEEAFSSPDMLKEKSRNGRKMVEKQWDEETMIQQYIRLYEDILTKKIR